MNDYEIRDAVVAVVELHLPEAKIDKALEYELHPETLLSLEYGPFAKHIEQIRALADLEQSIQSARTAYEKLNWHVRKTLEGAANEQKRHSEQHDKTAWFFNENDQTENKPRWTPYHELRPLGRLLSTFAQYASGGDGQDAFEVSRQSLRHIQEPSDQEVAHETMRKAFLVHRLRRIWALQGKAAPRKAAPGSPFFVFVADVLMALGKGWDPESTINTWYTRQKLMDSWG